jgi:Domain of Unknown Function (DUF748)
LKLPRILRRKKKTHRIRKAFLATISFILLWYLVLEIFGGKILTAGYQDYFRPLKVSISDIDLNLLKGQITLNEIEVLRESGSRIALIGHFSFAPRFKKGTLYFNSIKLEDAVLDVSAADVPENLEKKSRPLKIKPRFDALEISRVAVTVRGVKGLEGDPFLTLREIQGSVDCKGHRLCLGNSYELKAQLMRQSEIQISGTSDFRTQKKLDIKGRIENVRLSVLNSILGQSSPVSAKSGKADLFTEYELSGSAGKGYVKLFVEDLEFEEKEDSKAGILATLLGELISEKKIEHFEVRVPVNLKDNKFEFEKVDLKKEVQRILTGRMLPKGFDVQQQAQELKSPSVP